MGGMPFTNSGYAVFEGAPGNVLLAFFEWSEAT